MIFFTIYLRYWSTASHNITKSFPAMYKLEENKRKKFELKCKIIFKD